MPELSYAVLETPAGWVGVLASPAGLRCLTLPRESADAAREELTARGGNAREDTARFDGLRERIQQYFRGVPVAFPDALDLEAATEFQRRVWRAAREIPYGETRSYAWIAGKLG
ncbi:MAG: MGMT family protein, partial [Chloroflexota bacterium]